MRSYEVEEGVWVAGETKLRVAGETGTVIRTSENSMLLAISIYQLLSGQTYIRKYPIREFLMDKMRKFYPAGYPAGWRITG